MGDRDAIHTDGAPAAGGAYSQAIRGGGLVFAAGQIGSDPATGELVADNAADQATRALDNLAAVLEAAGSGLHRVVKTTVFLADINDFAAVNEAYSARMPAPYPARSTFAVRDLPRGARVEIECIALEGGG
jgi:2-iminobutanoate/2-iminopropanoate deaminase